MRVDRMISIIMILLDKKRISAQSLADTFEVSLRTIYRDLDAIDLAGIPIRSVSGVGGGFEIMPRYKLDKNVFSTSDISSILMSLTGMSNVLSDDALLYAMNKVKTLIPEEKEKDISFRANQIQIDLSPWIGNREIQKNIERIKQGLQETRLLSFTYNDRHNNETRRRVEPYQLILKGNHWYCQAYCLDREDFRLFRLSRMSNLAVDDTYIVRKYQEPQLNFDETLADLQTTITLRIHKSLVDRILEFCCYDHFTQDTKDYYLVDFPFIENDFYYSILLSFGDKSECLAPIHVRSELKRRVNDISLLYNHIS